MGDAEIDELIDAGRADWESGAAMPSMPTGNQICSPECLYWLGYMLARGRDFFRRRDMALYPDTMEPRP